MASDNFTVQVGNLTDDPELRFTQNGTPVANFRLAVSQRIRQDDGTWRDGETNFFRVNAWRDQAENIAESLAKGNRAVVLGRLRTRAWETPEGEKRSVTEIDADEVAPSLRWAIAKPERAERSRNGERQTERGERRPAAVLSDPFETASAPREAWGRWLAEAGSTSDAWCSSAPWRCGRTNRSDEPQLA